MANLFKVNTLVLTKQEVVATGNNLYVNGILAGSGTYSTINALQETGSILFNRDTTISGGLEARISITGQQAWNTANNNGINLSGNLAQTGAALIARDLAVSGGLETRIQQTGTAVIIYSNSIGFSVSGSLGQSGSNLYSHIIGGDSALSGNLTLTGQTLFARDAAISGGLEVRIALTGQQAFLATSGASGVLQAQINALPTSTNLALTGSNLFNLITGLSGQVNINYATITNLALTGQQAWAAAQNNAQNLSGNLTQTGIILGSRINSLSGFSTGFSGVLQNQINALPTSANLALTGSNLFNLITGFSGQANTNFATVANLFITGSQAWNAANNNAINLSGNLTQTGVTLINRDNSISGVLQTAINNIAAGTGNLITNVVFTTGVQLIGGTKYFVGNTYIDNLYVTGSQFVVNTQDFYVADNWIVMNATGGARDSALFISTGITGVNATGAILGFDVPSNTWRFGFGSQLTDLINIPRIASGEAIDLLDTRLIQSGVNLGATIGNTGSIAWNAANNNSINLSGNLFSTGQTLFNRDTSISGGLESRIALTGAASIIYTNIYANSIGVTLSGNITTTGSILNNLIIGLSGQSNINYATIANLALTGSQAWNTANNNALNLSGNLTSTGATLISRDLAISGVLDGKINLVSGNLFTTGRDAVGNFGQISPHSTHTSFNTTPSRWGWTYVQGNIGAPNQSSAQWYRSRLSLGSEYTIGTGSASDYWLQMAVPRLGNKDIWFQTCEAGSTGAWISAGVTVSGILTASYLAISGGIDTVIRATGSAAWNAANNNGINLSGNLSQTGATLFARDSSISGGLEARLSLTGNLINARIDSLSGYLNKPIIQSITVSALYTVTSNDPQIIYCNFANPTALVFPAASTVSGRMWNIKSINTGAIYLSGSTFDGQSVYNMSIPYMSQVIHAQSAGYYLID